MTAAQLAAKIQAMQKEIEELKNLNKQVADQVQHYQQLLSVASVNGGSKDPLKIPPPRKYDGSQNGLKAFLMQCRLYFEYQAPNLGDDSNKVLTAIAYLDGSASAWAHPFLDDYLTNKHNPDDMNDSTKEMFASFGKFTKVLQETFGGPDFDREYERKLRRLK